MSTKMKASPITTQTLAEVFPEFMISCKVKNLAASSIENYRDKYRKLISIIPDSTSCASILVGFLRSLPCELEEAAKIDGCNLWRIYYSISLPLSLPGIMTIVIFKGISFWNQFLLPLLLASSENSRTLSIGIKMFVGKESSNYGMAFAALIISILPTAIFYFSLHDKILKGLVIGAIKG